MARPVATAIKDRALVQDRRGRLTRAAMAVFVRKGYHLATVRDIGRAAGFTQGTIYNYVRSKGDILYLVCDEVVSAYQEAVRGAVAGISDPRARLLASLQAIVRVMQERQEQILLLYHESHALDPAALRTILARVEGFIRTFEQLLAAAQPGRTPRALRLAANIVTFLPTIVALRRWDLGRRVPAAELATGLAEFMMRGLGMVDPPPRRANGRRTPGAGPAHPGRGHHGSHRGGRT